MSFYYKFVLHKKNAVEPNSNLWSACVCISIRCHYATDQVYCIDPWGRVCEASMRRCKYELFYLRKTIDYVCFQSLIIQKLKWRFISCEGCRSDALPYVQLFGAHYCDRKSEMEHIESKLHPVILINLCAEQCNFFVVVDVLDLVMLLFF